MLLVGFPIQVSVNLTTRISWTSSSPENVSLGWSETRIFGAEKCHCILKLQELRYTYFNTSCCALSSSRIIHSCHTQQRYIFCVNFLLLLRKPRNQKFAYDTDAVSLILQQQQIEQTVSDLSQQMALAFNPGFSVVKTQSMGFSKMLHLWKP